jgi:hypothetical protein
MASGLRLLGTKFLRVYAAAQEAAVKGPIETSRGVRFSEPRWFAGGASLPTAVKGPIETSRRREVWSEPRWFASW